MFSKQCFKLSQNTLANYRGAKAILAASLKAILRVVPSLLAVPGMQTSKSPLGYSEIG